MDTTLQFDNKSHSLQQLPESALLRHMTWFYYITQQWVSKHQQWDKQWRRHDERFCQTCGWTLILGGDDQDAKARDQSVGISSVNDIYIVTCYEPSAPKKFNFNLHVYTVMAKAQYVEEKCFY